MLWWPANTLELTLRRTLLQEELREANVHAKLEASGKDVGCDLAGGSRRRVSLQRYRIQRVRSASKVVSALLKIAKILENFFLQEFPP